MDASLGIGAAANLVGGIISMIAARRANEEMGRAFNVEQRQQEGFRNEAFSNVQRALPSQGVETARQQIGQGQANRQAAYERINQAPLAIGGRGQTTRDRQQYSMRGAARAKLGGYSDWRLQQDIARIRTQDALNKISSFSGAQAQIFPHVLSDAQHSQDDLAAIGQLIATIGGGSAAFAPRSFGGNTQFQLPAAPAANVGFDSPGNRDVSNIA